MPGRVDGKVAVLVGGGQTPGVTVGNGRATAMLLAREGARVFLAGRTLARLMELLEQRSPTSLEICALLHKHIATHLPKEPKFVGFDAPNEFLVGYGLDHAEDFRHLPYIASLQ